MDPPCDVCGRRPVLARGLCRTDYYFRARNGRVWTEEEVVRAARRRFTREQEAQAIRAIWRAYAGA